MLPYRRKRLQQPQGMSSIDWSNPITQGLAIAVMPNANGARELTLSTPSAKVGSPSNSVGSRGVASIGSGGANYFTFTDYDKYDLVGPITVIAVVDGISGGVSGGYLSKGPIDTANTPFFFGRSGSIVSLSRGGASDYQRFNTTNTVTAPDAPCVFGVTQNGVLGSGATCNYYLNGVTPGSSAGGGMANTVAAANALPVRFAGTKEKVYLALAFNRVLSGAEIKSLSDNPWQIFAPLRRHLYVPATSGVLNAAADGAAQSGGSANIATQVALAAVGLSSASGSAGLSTAIPLSAAGFAVSGGTANAVATVRISAAGLAQASGSAGLSAAVLLQGAGAAQAAGNAALAAQLNALASGAAQAAGSANLSGGAAGALNAAGQAQASGSAVLNVTVTLNATGGSQASGSANLSGGAPGQIAAGGGAQAGGSAQVVATVAISAAGYAQAMASGQLSIQIPLTAFGGAISAGSGVLTLVPDVVIEGVSEMLRVPGRRSLLVAPGRRFDLRV